MAKTGPVATITFEGDPFHKVETTFPAELAAALSQIRAAPEVRAVILHGSGDRFSGGANIAVLPELEDPSRARSWLTSQHSAIAELAGFGLPVIAAVHGLIPGAAMNIALAADFIVAARDATFRQSFIKIGLATDMGSLTLLPRRVGHHRARQLSYTARPVGADEALSIGLADQVVDPDELMDAATALAHELSRLPLAAFAATKAAYTATQGLSLTESLDIEQRLQIPVMATADYTAGTTAFLTGVEAHFGDRPTP
ncbi:enoyl-CoA hydratase/isomerase family protein [Mycobacterium paraterrae]|uniref:Enoyl-CoA hydratase/isomerase family protein n=1 Tax=Mycobacterium paraterrae TaxID=577492 RepID=A0ABY3VJH0_9MYCO|nr:enoyl-CoA hydratase/isomerase family protein [Mycobacterium paraterrae]UMB69539.1 enoyl-CoA hydratase/isomerase family protein [Mycobacterium paraterrae]